MNAKLIAKTAAALLAAGVLTGMGTVVAAPAEAAAAPKWPVLKMGGKGRNVRALQHLLTCSPQVGSVQADGMYGRKTVRLVRNYERDVDLVKPDGIVGPRTWTSLTSNRHFKSQVKRGDKGACVKAAQVLLKKHGYKVKVDGTFGKDTRKAAIQFEKAKGLAADGIIGLRTWRQLIATKR